MASALMSFYYIHIFYRTLTSCFLVFYIYIPELIRCVSTFCVVTIVMCYFILFHIIFLIPPLSELILLELGPIFCVKYLGRGPFYFLLFWADALRGLSAVLVPKGGSSVAYVGIYIACTWRPGFQTCVVCLFCLSRSVRAL